MSHLSIDINALRDDEGELESILLGAESYIQDPDRTPIRLDVSNGRGYLTLGRTYRLGPEQVRRILTLLEDNTH